MIVYTTGYSGDKCPRGIHKNEALRQTLCEPGNEHGTALLFDIRFKPWSMAPCWRKEAMQAFFGADVYRHVPALGNKNYRGTLDDGGEIQIVDMAAGIREILSVAPRPVVLLCGCETAYVECADGTREGLCHRYEIAVSGLAKCPEIEDVIELGRWAIGRGDE